MKTGEAHAVPTQVIFGFEGKQFYAVFIDNESSFLFHMQVFFFSRSVSYSRKLDSQVLQKLHEILLKIGRFFNSVILFDTVV